MGPPAVPAVQVADLEARLGASASERERLEQRTAQLEAEVGAEPAAPLEAGRALSLLRRWMQTGC